MKALLQVPFAIFPFATLKMKSTLAFRAMTSNLSCAILLSASLLSFPMSVAGQGVGTTYKNNGPSSVPFGSVREIVEETAYFGPNSVWTLTGGDLIVYSKNVWIAPGAQFSGIGSLIFRNPSVKSGAPSATIIDGNNGNFIGVNVSLENASGMILTDIVGPADAGYAITNPTGSSAAALKIGNEFNFNVASGKVFLNGNDFSFDGDAVAVNYQDTRFVDTGNLITGHMTKIFTSNVPFVFPVGFGTTNPYNPARITAPSGTVYVSVQTNAASAASEDVLRTDPKGYVDRTWHIFASVATANAKVELQHSLNTGTAGFLTNTPHVITTWEGANLWSELQPDVAGSLGSLSQGSEPKSAGTLRDVTTTIVAGGASPQSYWTKAFSTNPALPVTLMSFTVASEGTTALLNWKTSSETNSSTFEIQRSQDVKEWIKIGEVAAIGESTTDHNYSFTDGKPASGTNYYRLKMIDLDGTYAFSSIEKLGFDSQAKISLYPNPVSEYITIDMADFQDVSKVEILNAAGKEVYTSGTKPADVIPVKQLGAGMYIVKIKKSDDNVITKRIVVSN